MKSKPRAASKPTVKRKSGAESSAETKPKVTKAATATTDQATDQAIAAANFTSPVFLKCTHRQPPPGGAPGDWVDVHAGCTVCKYSVQYMTVCNHATSPSTQQNDVTLDLLLRHAVSCDCWHLPDYLYHLPEDAGAHWLLKFRKYRKEYLQMRAERDSVQDTRRKRPKSQSPSQPRKPRRTSKPSKARAVRKHDAKLT